MHYLIFFKDQSKVLCGFFTKIFICCYTFLLYMTFTVGIFSGQFSFLILIKGDVIDQGSQ